VDHKIPIMRRRYHDKEAFVTGHEGSTTPFEVFLLCLVVPVSLYLHRTIVIAITAGSPTTTRDCPHQQHQRRDVAVEFLTIILPMLLVQTSLLTFIIGPCLLLLGMVAVAGAVRQRTTHRIRSIVEEDATNNNLDNRTVSRVKVQEEQEDIRTLPRDIFGRITPVKKNNENLASTAAAVDATPRKQKSRTKMTKTTTTTTTVMDTTITTPTRDVFGRIKYNINNELSSSSSKEDVTNTNNNNKETESAAVTIAQLTHNNNNHNHTNVTNHTNRPIYLSAHRAYVYLLTTIAILAVDFPLFPRRYCKTEVVGYGFMDLGAASFVIVAGWTSVLQHHQYQQSIAGSNHYYKVMKKCTPLLLIGLIRLATTKGLEYQEHVSEYGIHWNFFFTLCCIELIMILWKQIKTTFCNSALRTSATYISVDLVLGVAFMVTYQLYLSQYGGQEFIVYANRQCFANTNSSLCNAFAANREGILGVIGYCSLRLLSECIAKVCLLLPPPPPSSSSNDAISSQRRRLFYSSMGLWLLHFLLTVCLHIPNSRRTTNASFILWALAHNTSLLTCIHVVVDKTGNNNKNSDRRLDSEYYTLPWILSSVNDFGLAVFLSSNVLTGLVNLTFDTLHSSNNKAMLILSVYLALVCGFALFLDTLFKRRREKVD